MLENLSQRHSKRGIFAVEERRANLNFLASYLKKIRQQGEIEISQKKLFSEMAMKLGVTKRKFLEYLEIMEGKEFVVLEKDQVILKRLLDNAI